MNPMLLAAALFVQPSDKVQISPSVSVQPAHRAAAPRCDFDRAKSPILPYAQGEELTYLVSVQGVRAGSANFRLGGLERTPHGAGYTIRADFETNAFASVASDLQGKVLSLLDPRDQRSRFYRNDLKRGAVEYRDRASFGEKGIDWSYHVGKRRRAGKMRGSKRGFDPLVVLYNLRDLKFQTNQRICARVYGFRTLRRVDGMIQSEETIQTLAGPMKTWRVQLTIHEGKRKRKLTVWVGQEEERPVWRAELKSTKGTMVMELARHVLGKGPIYRL
ncbi:MAG: hypothetical protein CMH50_08940 [Myxococcales bacterium]|nr:hypothetical protein [Myxococcales bacterium]|tara:strand:- start:622 stop:1446 length:825 start_codon:yes stop_codon:yes gene_type:complete